MSEFFQLINSLYYFLFLHFLLRGLTEYSPLLSLSVPSNISDFFLFYILCSFSQHPSLRLFHFIPNMDARRGSDTFPGSLFLSQTASLSSPPISCTISWARTNAEISPRPHRGNWHQIAVKMEMPIKLTARLQLSFLFTLQVNSGAYGSDLLKCTGRGEKTGQTLLDRDQSNSFSFYYSKNEQYNIMKNEQTGK